MSLVEMLALLSVQASPVPLDRLVMLQPSSAACAAARATGRTLAGCPGARPTNTGTGPAAARRPRPSTSSTRPRRPRNPAVTSAPMTGFITCPGDSRCPRNFTGRFNISAVLTPGARIIVSELASLSQTEWLNDDAMFEIEAELRERASVADFRSAADAGDARAQYLMARLYAFGVNVPQDNDQALRWFQRAAASGEPRSRTDIGFRYETGNGVPQSLTEAIRLYRLAAAQGEVYALTNLGILYRDGNGVSQDYGQAMRYFRQAADAGHPQAMTHVGYLLSEGLGVPVNLVAALRWYRMAAAEDEPFAKYHVGRFMFDGLGGATQDQQRGLQLIREAAAADVGGARSWLEERGFPVE
jgi:hypothetical protein